MVITDQPSRILKAISYTANVVTEEAKREINNTIRRGADFESYTYSNNFRNDGYDNGKGKYGEDKKDCCGVPLNNKFEEVLCYIGAFVGCILCCILVERCSKNKSSRNSDSCCEDICNSVSSGFDKFNSSYQTIPGNNVSGFSTRSDNINLASDVGNNGNHR